MYIYFYFLLFRKVTPKDFAEIPKYWNTSSWRLEWNANHNRIDNYGCETFTYNGCARSSTVLSCLGHLFHFSIKVGPYIVIQTVNHVSNVKDGYGTKFQLMDHYRLWKVHENVQTIRSSTVGLVLGSFPQSKLLVLFIMSFLVVQISNVDSTLILKYLWKTNRSLDECTAATVHSTSLQGCLFYLGFFNHLGL